MSILLDAVTRNKQQQASPLPDAVLTPRASYPAPRKASFPAAKLSLLAVAITLGIGVAWGVAHWQQVNSMMPLKANDDNRSDLQTGTVITQHASNTGSDSSVSTSQANRTASLNDPVSAVTTVATQEDTVTQGNAAGFRLAGKVALPREQVLNDVPLSAQAYPSVDSSQVVATNTSSNADPSYDDYLATSAALDETTRAQPSSAENGELAQEFADPEPIMLGANANRQGLATLEALRQQVNAAATDVGLDTAQSRQDDELVATFQDALKEVEYVKAAKTPVTEPKLDPIPKTENGDIPKYGQLPAGLQLQVPEFNIVAHVYSTDASQRWLNVDGAELQEGDMIGGKLKIIAIRPRDVVLDIQGTQFRVPAM
ncbi:MAG: general secretion pathway protein GspB [Shewanella xiamenensis]